ncbi:hypothetical protein D3C81_1340640 [compost metagenome]
MQQAIAIQVKCLLFGVDRVEAKGDFLFRIGRTDAFQQAQPLAFQTIEADLILMLLGLVERVRQLDRLQRLTIDQIVSQQRGNERRALGGVRKAVDDRDDIGTRQGFNLQIVNGFLGQAIQCRVAHRIGFHTQCITQRIDHVFAQRRADVTLERFGQFAEHPRRRVVLTLIAQFADGLTNQRRRTEDIAFGLHVRQRWRNEGGAVLGQRGGRIALRQLFRLHDHLRGDIEALFEQQRQQQRDHCKDQEDALHQLLVGEENPEELVQVIFFWVHVVHLRVSCHCLCCRRGSRS